MPHLPLSLPLSNPCHTLITGLTRDLEHAHGVEENVVQKLRKQAKKVEGESEELRIQLELGTQREADVEGTLH